MGKLSAGQRHALPAKAFAGPDRSYPVNNRAHAQNALSRVSQHGKTAALKAQVRAKIRAKYPDLGKID